MKILGIALIVGSVLVSGVLLWLLGVYRQDGQLADGLLIGGGLFLFGLIVLPQLGFGIYLLRSDRQKKDGL
ncbi:MAG: hypothetical protein KC415_07530 [Anaerolineales bacterium]|nr:hypothetical protein [Anaerolineales bacterium]MCB9003503.1 hypothetical protein [Ardenticatenaceae bacterium]